MICQRTPSRPLYGKSCSVKKISKPKKSKPAPSKTATKKASRTAGFFTTTPTKTGGPAPVSLKKCRKANQAVQIPRFFTISAPPTIQNMAQIVTPTATAAAFWKSAIQFLCNIKKTATVSANSPKKTLILAADSNA